MEDSRAFYKFMAKDDVVVFTDDGRRRHAEIIASDVYEGNKVYLVKFRDGSREYFIESAIAFEKDLSTSVTGVDGDNSTVEASKVDMVNHPSHYKVGGIESIDVLKAKMTKVQFEGYCLGNAMKYLQRANFKGNFIQDIEKADFYLKELVANQ